MDRETKLSEVYWVLAPKSGLKKKEADRGRGFYRYLSLFYRNLFPFQLRFLYLHIIRYYACSSIIDKNRSRTSLSSQGSMSGSRPKAKRG